MHRPLHCRTGAAQGLSRRDHRAVWEMFWVLPRRVRAIKDDGGTADFKPAEHGEIKEITFHCCDYGESRQVPPPLPPTHTHPPAHAPPAPGHRPAGPVDFRHSIPCAHVAFYIRVAPLSRAVRRRQEGSYARVVLMRDKNRRREDVLYYFPGWGLSEFFVDEEIFNRRVAAAAGRPALHGLKHTGNASRVEGCAGMGAAAQQPPIMPLRLGTNVPCGERRHYWSK